MKKILFLLATTLFLCEFTHCQILDSDEIRSTGLPNAPDGLNYVKYNDGSIKLVNNIRYKKDEIKATYNCPIKISQSYVTSNLINNPVAGITYINVSEKDIDAVEFEVICFDNFNKRVFGLGRKRVFSALSQEILQSGVEVANEWDLTFFDNATKIKPTVLRVHFSDGTTWPTRKKNKPTNK